VDEGPVPMTPATSTARNGRCTEPGDEHTSPSIRLRDTIGLTDNTVTTVVPHVHTPVPGVLGVRHSVQHVVVRVEWGRTTRHEDPRVVGGRHVTRQADLNVH